MFDDVDYGDTFGSFDYSSGESLPFLGDGQLNDYGFNGGNVDYADWWTGGHDQTTGFGPDVYDYGAGPNEYNYGSTPEVTTNDFGTTFDPAFGDTAVKTAVEGAKLASAAQTVLSKPGATGAPASSGSSGAKQAATNTGSNDILATFGNVISGISNVAKTVGGTASQLTTAQNRSYSGQLTPTGGAAPGVLGMSTNTLLMVGLGLLAVGFILKKG